MESFLLMMQLFFLKEKKLNFPVYMAALYLVYIHKYLKANIATCLYNLSYIISITLSHYKVLIQLTFYTCVCICNKKNSTKIILDTLKITKQYGAVFREFIVMLVLITFSLSLNFRLSDECKILPLIKFIRCPQNFQFEILDIYNRVVTA